jgi:hypothetical protein
MTHVDLTVLIGVGKGKILGKQEFRRKDLGSRLLAAEGEGEGAVRVRRRGVSEMKQYPSGSG